MVPFNVGAFPHILSPTSINKSRSELQVVSVFEVVSALHSSPIAFIQFFEQYLHYVFPFHRVKLRTASNCQHTDCWSIGAPLSTIFLQLLDAFSISTKQISTNPELKRNWLNQFLASYLAKDQNSGLSVRHQFRKKTYFSRLVLMEVAHAVVPAR